VKETEDWKAAIREDALRAWMPRTRPRRSLTRTHERRYSRALRCHARGGAVVQTTRPRPKAELACNWKGHGTLRSGQLIEAVGYRRLIGGRGLGRCPTQCRPREEKFIKAFAADIPEAKSPPRSTWMASRAVSLRMSGRWRGLLKGPKERPKKKAGYGPARRGCGSVEALQRLDRDDRSCCAVGWAMTWMRLEGPVWNLFGKRGIFSLLTILVLRFRPGSHWLRRQSLVVRSAIRTGSVLY